MGAFKKITNIINVTSLGIGVAIQQGVIGYLSNKALVSGSVLKYLLSVFLILVVYFVSNLVLSKLSNIKLLKRIILGEDFIEGQWFEIAYNPKSNVRLSYSLLTIKTNRDLIIVHGDSYDFETNEYIGSFSSNTINYQYPFLTYSFTYYQANDKSPTEGISKIKFISRFGKQPLMHSGYFIDIETHEKINFNSWKITSSKDLNKLNDPHNFKSKIQELLTTYNT